MEKNIVQGKLNIENCRGGFCGFITQDTGILFQ